MKYCSNVDRPRDDHTKWSKSERERQTPNGITYKWNLRYDTNKLIYKTETHSQTQNRLVVANGGGVGGKDWEFGISRCKLLYEKQHTCVCV